MKKLLFVLALVLFLSAFSAWAQEGTEEQPQGQEPTPTAEPEEPKIVKPHASFSFFAGAHLMRDENWEKVYGNAPIFYFGFTAGLKLIADLELWGEIGYSVDEGSGITSQGQSTSEKFRIHLVPASLGLLYRLKFFENQLIVPFLGGAANLYYFYEGRLESSEKVDGGKWGYSGFGGLQLLLDNADPRAAASMKSEFGIDNTYLFYEFRYSSVNDWGEEEGMDFSSLLHIGGLLFEF